jgi:hypothetical protein
MEDMQREINLKKQNDKDFQVKKVLKGLETQDAWQMYNSLIFANPSDLPDAKDLKKTHERILIGGVGLSSKTKNGALTSQTKRK